MYADHQPTIAAYALASPTGFARTVTFVLASIKRYFSNVHLVMDRPEYFTPAGQRGYAYVQCAAHALWHFACTHHTAEDRLRRYMDIPGLAYCKAGFLCQLVHGQVGCLDTHNLKRFGLSPTAFRVPNTTEASTERLRVYVTTCEGTAGGPQALWDDWCHIQARLYPQVWRSAEHASAYHVACIVPAWGSAAHLPTVPPPSLGAAAQGHREAPAPAQTPAGTTSHGNGVVR
jgi:hypothetical protein